jgi:hypothetical protein
MRRKYISKGGAKTHTHARVEIRHIIIIKSCFHALTKVVREERFKTLACKFSLSVRTAIISLQIAHVSDC